MLDVYLVNGDIYLCHSYCDFGKVGELGLAAHVLVFCF